MTEWIKWDGGECPIPDAKAGEYEVEFEDGATRGNSSGSINAHLYDWTNTEAPLDIIAYRLIEKEQSDLDWLEGEIENLKIKGGSLGVDGEFKDHWIARESVLDLIKARKEAKS